MVRRRMGRRKKRRKHKSIEENDEALIIIPLVPEEIDYENLEEWDIEDYDVPNVRMKMFKSAMRLAKKRRTDYIA